MPILYIIVGPNGSGKTTSAERILLSSLNCTEFISANAIARGISPFNPKSAIIQAREIATKRIEELMKQGISFAIETTLSRLNSIELIKDYKSKGYETVLKYGVFYSPDILVKEVKNVVPDGKSRFELIYEGMKAAIAEVYEEARKNGTELVISTKPGEVKKIKVS